MLGLGNNLISGVYVEGEAASFTLGITAILASASHDEAILVLVACDSTTVSGLNLASISANARVPGVTANVTIVHTHGDGNTELDPHVTEASKTMYAYKYLSSYIYLANTDAETQAGSSAVNLTASPFSGIDAVGTSNKYNITVNYIAKSGLTNSGSRTKTALSVNAFTG